LGTKGLAVASQQCTISHSFFTRYFLITKNNMIIVLHSPYSLDLAPCDSSLFLRLEGHHFDTIEVIEAEFQAALNALTEHKLQVASKNGRSAA
jgi:hypothetical protein